MTENTSQLNIYDVRRIICNVAAQKWNVHKWKAKILIVIELNVNEQNGQLF